MTAYLLAQEPTPAPPQKQPQQDGLLGGFGGLPLMAGLMVLFFLVVMLPAQRRQKREQAAMLASIKPGAKVVISPGIVGKVVKAKEGEDEITVQSEDSKLRVLRSTVVRVIGEEPAAEAKS